MIYNHRFSPRIDLLPGPVDGIWPVIMTLGACLFYLLIVAIFSMDEEISIGVNIPFHCLVQFLCRRNVAIGADLLYIAGVTGV